MAKEARNLGGITGLATRNCHRGKFRTIDISHSDWKWSEAESEPVVSLGTGLSQKTKSGRKKRGGSDHEKFFTPFRDLFGQS
jgi:hypothetical protein